MWASPEKTFSPTRTVLLPAIAVEAPGASPRLTFIDTKGQALRILAILLLALAPWISAIFVSVILLGPRVSVTGSPQTRSVWSSAASYNRQSSAYPR
jgi:hypothetical protein